MMAVQVQVKPWRTVEAAELAANVKNAFAMGPFGSRITKDNFIPCGVPVIRGTNIAGDRFSHDDLVYVSEEKADELRASVAHPGDLVFTHRGTLGQVGLIPHGHFDRYVVSQSQMKLTCDISKVIPAFLLYYFRSPLGQHELLSHTGGSGVPAISSPLTTLKGAKVRLPPLPIQRKIAAILSAYDDLIENNTRRIALLEAMAQALYREWFVRFRFPGHQSVPLVDSPLGPIPEGWRMVNLGDVAGVFRGRSYASSNLVDDGGLPFLNLKCIDRGGGFRYDGMKQYLGPYKESQVARRGDIIVAVTDMTQERRIVARAARVPPLGDDFSIFSMDLVRLDPIPGIPSEYVYGLLRYSGFADAVKQHANGANVLHLHPDRIADYEFALPSEQLQRRYADACNDYWTQAETLEQRNANLRRTRDLLLPKLVSGAVDVVGMKITGVDIPALSELES